MNGILTTWYYQTLEYADLLTHKQVGVYIFHGRMVSILIKSEGAEILLAQKGLSLYQAALAYPDPCHDCLPVFPRNIIKVALPLRGSGITTSWKWHNHFVTGIKFALLG